ncbi:MAG: SH3 domain-containing protein [Bacteroidota bacterium]
MQNLSSKIIYFCFFCLISFTSLGQEGDMSSSLGSADSLFEKKKYTESFEIYNSILETGQQASLSMLLKMAFIKEGLGDYGEALYYLNLYYLRTSNKEVAEKMEQLAEAQDIQGYSSSESDLVANLYFRFSDYIAFALSAFIVLVFSLMLRAKIKSNKDVKLAGIAIVLLLGVLFLMVNFGKAYRKAVVAKPNTYLMSGPSSGSEVVDIIKSGHRVKVIAQEDVWLKIKWNDEVAYIKENNIKPLSF